MLDIFIFLLLLRPALHCVDAGSRKPHHVAAAFVAMLLDVWIAHTTWALIAGMPRKGERTISDTLERLCLDINNPDWPLYYALARKINRISPTGDHIKAAIK
jgi:hypothetical protein